jgi:hypothetical protein
MFIKISLISSECYHMEPKFKNVNDILVDVYV